MRTDTPEKKADKATARLAKSSLRGWTTTPPGPVSHFRRKIRAPVTLTLTPEHHVKVNRAMERLGLSRADTIALLIDQFADTVRIPK